MFKRIVIVGGGTAGWMTAAIFSKAWPDEEKPSITLIESPKVERVGVGESSIPPLRRLIKTLGIDEAEWMKASHATYKCSLHLVGWQGNGGRDDYYHPLFRWGEDDPELFTNWLNARVYEDYPEDFDMSSFESAWLARDRKAPKDAIGSDHAGPVQYAYHLDAALFAEYLAGWSAQRGVELILDSVVDVSLDEQGNIGHLVTENSGDLAGDLFIDCTGFCGLLINKVMKERFIPYTDSLFCDNAVAISTFKDEPLKDIPCETRATALKAGWVWDIPLSHRHGCGYVYSGAELSSEQAEQELRDHLGDLRQGAARHIKMRVGRNERSWVKNCVSIGLSSSFIEPLESTSIFSIQYGIAEFLRALRVDCDVDAKRDQYNSLMRDIVEGIRDFIIAHYYLSGRADTGFWRAASEDASLPDALKEILETWKRGDDIEALLAAHGSSRIVSPVSWYCIFAGCGYLPDKIKRSPASTRAIVEQRRRLVMEMAGAAPDHGDLLATIA